MSITVDGSTNTITSSAASISVTKGINITGALSTTGGIELGHASDTTLSRVSAGVAAIEGVNILTTATGAALAGSAAQAFNTALLTSTNVKVTDTLTSAGTVGMGGDGGGGLFLNGGSAGNVTIGNSGVAYQVTNATGTGFGKSPVCRLDVTDSVTTRLANFNSTGANGVGVGFSHSGTDIGHLGSDKFLVNGTLGDFGISAIASLVLYGGNQATNKLVMSATGATITGTLTGSSTIKTGGYTVATLPAGTVGMRAYVTDATAPTYLGALTGGGAVVCPVFYNGAAWVSA